MAKVTVYWPEVTNIFVLQLEDLERKTREELMGRIEDYLNKSPEKMGEVREVSLEGIEMLKVACRIRNAPEIKEAIEKIKDSLEL